MGGIGGTSKGRGEWDAGSGVFYRAGGILERIQAIVVRFAMVVSGNDSGGSWDVAGGYLF